MSRPTSNAVRLAGVTRSASMTPSRHSPMRLKPTKKAPKMPSWTSMPGTKNVQALVAPNWLISGLSRGPNSSR